MSDREEGFKRLVAEFANEQGFYDHIDERYAYDSGFDAGYDAGRSAAVERERLRIYEMWAKQLSGPMDPFEYVAKVSELMHKFAAEIAVKEVGDE